MSCLYSVLLDSRRGLNVMFFVFHEMLGVFLFLVLFMVLNYSCCHNAIGVINDETMAIPPTWRMHRRTLDFTMEGFA